MVRPILQRTMPYAGMLHFHAGFQPRTHDTASSTSSRYGLPDPLLVDGIRLQMLSRCPGGMSLGLTTAISTPGSSTQRPHVQTSVSITAIPAHQIPK